MWYVALIDKGWGHPRLLMKKKQYSDLIPMRRLAVRDFSTKEEAEEVARKYATKGYHRIEVWDEDQKDVFLMERQIHGR